MRHLLFFVICALSVAACGESENNEVYNENNTSVSGGIVYNINEEPINGLYRVYYPNGNVKMEVQSQHGLPNGVGKFYAPNGILLFQGNFINGHPDGILYNYYKGERIHNEMHYVNGVKEGIQKVYNKDGTLMAEVIFENGKPKSGYTIVNDEKVTLTPEELEGLK